MLNFIKTTLFWKRDFDSAFRTYMGFFEKFDSHTLNEKRYHWRERLGRLDNLPPREAAFKAFQDFANTYYKETPDKNDASAVLEFQEIAGGLEMAAPYQDRDGNLKERRSFLSERWRAYFDDYKTRRDKEKAERKRKFNEVIAIRFTDEQLDTGWNQLVSGDIPSSVKGVWRAAHATKTPYQISEDANVSLHDTVFWALVLRNQGLMSEWTYAGEESRYVRLEEPEQPITLDRPRIKFDEQRQNLINKFNE